VNVNAIVEALSRDRRYLWQARIPPRFWTEAKRGIAASGGDFLAIATTNENYSPMMDVFILSVSAPNILGVRPLHVKTLPLRVGDWARDVGIEAFEMSRNLRALICSEQP
jgi:hypothetical protein